MKDSAFYKIENLQKLRRFAISLIQSNRFREAFECYLILFGHTRHLPDWQATRVTFILSDVAFLAERYAPAAQQLITWLAECETDFLAGGNDPYMVMEWVQLCKLIEPSRITSFYDELSEDIYGELREQIKEVAYSDFINLQNYKALDDRDMRFIVNGLHGLVNMLKEQNSLSNSTGEKRDMVEILRKILLREISLIFEYVLNRRSFDDALLLIDALTNAFPAEQIYPVLFAAARKSQDGRCLAMLNAKAKAVLNPSVLEGLN